MENIMKQKNRWLIAGLILIPFVFVATSFEFALGIGLTFAIIFLLSSVILKALYKVVDMRLSWVLIFIVSAVVTFIMQRVLELFIHELYAQLGVYMVMFVANLSSLLLTKEALENTTVLDQLKNVLHVIALALIWGLLREILATGTIHLGTLFGESTDVLKSLGLSKYGMIIFSQPSGGLILLGIILAIFNRQKTNGEVAA